MSLIKYMMALNQAKAYTDSQRIAYKETRWIDLLSESSAAFTPLDELGGLPALLITDTWGITEGQIIRVSWESVLYECVFTKKTIEDSIYEFFGNGSIIGISDDTGEPFICVSISGGFVLISQYEGIYSVVISVEKEITTKIPVEYIPDRIPVVTLYDYPIRSNGEVIVVKDEDVNQLELANKLETPIVVIFRFSSSHITQSMLFQRDVGSNSLVTNYLSRDLSNGVLITLGRNANSEPPRWTLSGAL